MLADTAWFVWNVTYMVWGEVRNFSLTKKCVFGLAWDGSYMLRYGCTRKGIAVLIKVFLYTWRYSFNVKT